MGKKHKLIFEQRSLESWLFEQEEPPADETPDEAIEAADEEEEGGDEQPGDEDAPEEEEEEVDVTPDDEVKLSKSIDQDLEALMIDFETQARKSREIEHSEEETEITIEEGLGLRFLLEQEHTYEEEIDLDRFASEVARLVKNYTSLLDMEKMLVNKAREFIVTRYGDVAEKEMIDILADKHDIEVLEPSDVVDSTLEVPIAVGAGTGGAGGGGGGGV